MSYRDVERVTCAPFRLVEIRVFASICERFNLRRLHGRLLLQPRDDLASVWIFFHPADDRIYLFSELVVVLGGRLRPVLVSAIVKRIPQRCLHGRNLALLGCQRCRNLVELYASLFAEAEFLSDFHDFLDGDVGRVTEGSTVVPVFPRAYTIKVIVAGVLNADNQRFRAMRAVAVVVVTAAELSSAELDVIAVVNLAVRVEPALEGSNCGNRFERRTWLHRTARSDVIQRSWRQRIARIRALNRLPILRRNSFCEYIRIVVWVACHRKHLRSFYIYCNDSTRAAIRILHELPVAVFALVNRARLNGLDTLLEAAFGVFLKVEVDRQVHVVTRNWLRLADRVNVVASAVYEDALDTVRASEFGFHGCLDTVLTD